ncbi:unnamed protein product [Rhizophagus irregularis]|nr:unnamed protein product [Rhizophagus irregularis]
MCVDAKLKRFMFTQQVLRCLHIPESTPKIHNIDDEDGALLHCIMTQTKQYGKGLERFAVNIFQLSSTHISVWSKLHLGVISNAAFGIKREMICHRRVKTHRFPLILGFDREVPRTPSSTL